MNPLVLLGAAIAFLWFTKKTEPVSVTGTPTLPSDPLTETFNNVPPAPSAVPIGTFTSVSLPPKTKPMPIAEPAPIQGISPMADGAMPPYVYDQVSGVSFGAFESEPLLME